MNVIIIDGSKFEKINVQKTGSVIHFYIYVVKRNGRRYYMEASRHKDAWGSGKTTHPLILSCDGG
jgi:hypothetical protein